MQKKREAAATAAAPDDDCGLTHFYAAAKLPSGGWKSDGSARSIIFDPESAENSVSIINPPLTVGNVGRHLSGP